MPEQVTELRQLIAWSRPAWTIDHRDGMGPLAARATASPFVNRSAAQHMRAWRERWQPQRLPPEAARPALRTAEILRD